MKLLLIIFIAECSQVFGNEIRQLFHPDCENPIYRSGVSCRIQQHKDSEMNECLNPHIQYHIF